MYVVSVLNASPYTWRASDGTTIPTKEVWKTEKPIGNAWVQSTELGTVNFLDIGDVHIGGDSKETWGVLISYQGEEVVGRYEGEGALQVMINQFGQVELSHMDLRQV